MGNTAYCNNTLRRQQRRRTTNCTNGLTINSRKFRRGRLKQRRYVVPDGAQPHVIGPESSKGLSADFLAYRERGHGSVCSVRAAELAVTRADGRFGRATTRAEIY